MSLITEKRNTESLLDVNSLILWLLAVGTLIVVDGLIKDLVLASRVPCLALGELRLENRGDSRWFGV